ncbi:hypothetical protein [Nocardia arthritidis]|uniref:Uncharacterized protein n=1 Tax=Nocardia arthritidis TaxID=228602 RepID=A0A6G9Y5Q2_9NOCA|nr:hypothetical protein [Nocardia arthritidis]QIS08430.1 hypothetical protein F5544_02550 [Nocardia arthritidis]
MTRFLAVLAGALLVTAVGIMAPVLTIPAAVLVVAGWWFRPAAVAAVLLAIAALAIADTGVLSAAATGLVCTTYLLNTATVTAPAGVVPTTIPSVAGAITFAAAAALSAFLPLNLAWAPIAAPILIIALYTLVIQGLARRSRTGDQPAAPTG